MTTPMPPDRLEDIKGKHGALKSGGWRVSPAGSAKWWHVDCMYPELSVCTVSTCQIDPEATAEFIAMCESAVPELIREVKRQRDEILQLAGEAMRTAGEIIDMKEDEFIAGTHLETEGPHAGWRDTMALGSMFHLGDELVALGMYERHPDGIHRRWWYRRKASKP